MVTKKTSPFEVVRTIISSQPRLITMITKRGELLQPPPPPHRAERSGAGDTIGRRGDQVKLFLIAGTVSALPLAVDRSMRLPRRFTARTNLTGRACCENTLVLPQTHETQSITGLLGTGPTLRAGRCQTMTRLKGLPYWYCNIFISSLNYKF